MKEELSDIAQNLAEIGLDTFLSEGFYRDLPVVSMVVGLAKCAKSIPDLIFASKVLKFLTAISNIEEKKKKAFFNKICKDKDKIKKCGQTIIFNLNSVNCLKKSAMIGLLFKSYIIGKINFEIFENMCNVVSIANTGDLISLIYAVKENILWKNPRYGYLIHTDFIETKYDVKITEDEGLLVQPSYTPTSTAIKFGKLCEDALVI